MSNIEWILIIITIFLVILLFRYIQLKKQIRNLADQVNELNSGNSQQMLDISLIDKDLERLAGILNQYNIRQRQAVAGVLRNEEYLKESVANISHDLRTPLTVILGHLQLLQKENLESSQAQRVKVIFSKAEKMKELVETFYDLSILEEQQTVPEKEKFNISNMLINLILIRGMRRIPGAICGWALLEAAPKNTYTAWDCRTGILFFPVINQRNCIPSSGI